MFCMVATFDLHPNFVWTLVEANTQISFPLGIVILLDSRVHIWLGEMPLQFSPIEHSSEIMGPLTSHQWKCLK